MQRATQPDAQYKQEASTDTWTYMHSVSSPTCKHTGKNSPKVHTKNYNLVKIILLLSQYMAILLVNNVTYQFPLQILVFISFIKSEITFIFSPIQSLCNITHYISSFSNNRNVIHEH